LNGRDEYLGEKNMSAGMYNTVRVDALEGSEQRTAAY
jgi:hypothetical protein